MKKIFIASLAACVVLQLCASPKNSDNSSQSSTNSKSDSTSASTVDWKTDLPAANEQAKKENKLVLLDFTGSDWCGWCIKLNHDTFSKPEWAAYAKTNLVSVEVDFPRAKEQSEAQKSANEALQKKYNVEGFPTIIVTKPDGTVVWKNEGYLSGGPKAMIDAIETARKKA